MSREFDDYLHNLTRKRRVTGTENARTQAMVEQIRYDLKHNALSVASFKRELVEYLTTLEGRLRTIYERLPINRS